jgi:UPF0755 protein
MVARLKGYDKRLKAGEYALSATMTPIQIMEKLVKGKVKLYKLTVPEGLNIFQIANLVAEAGFAQNSSFIAAATDADLARKNGITAETLEGYLFPETYYFPKKVSIETVISTMVKRFRKVFNSAWKQRANQLGFSIHQIVTLASIIEKETGAPFERPVISSVFHNRLKRKMRLESDPTVIYGLKNFDGNLKRTHLETPTPYNTYKIRGLPAGPIANPAFPPAPSPIPAKNPWRPLFTQRTQNSFTLYPKKTKPISSPLILRIIIEPFESTSFAASVVSRK